MLKDLIDQGHRLILLTMRSDDQFVEVPKERKGDICPEPGLYLSEAREWFRKKGIALWGVNQNPDQHKWSSSRKVFGHVYLDDAALGMPLVTDPDTGKRYVDWVKTRDLLIQRGYLAY